MAKINNAPEIKGDANQKCYSYIIDSIPCVCSQMGSYQIEELHMQILNY